MKVLYFNYMPKSLPTLIRTLELAKALSQQEVEVTLVYMAKKFSPPPFFYDVLESAKSNHLNIIYTRNKELLNPKDSFPLQSSIGTTGIGPQIKQNQKIQNSHSQKKRVWGLLKQMVLSLQYLPEELSLIRKIKPHVLIARPDHILSFVISSKLTHTPLVLETDGPVEELEFFWGFKSNFLVTLDLWRARQGKSLLYISTLCQDLWLKKSFPKNKLFYCPNAADINFFKPTEKKFELLKELNLQDAETIFGFSGNQRKWHGVHLLIEKIVPLLQENPRLKLLVIGTLEEKESLQLEKVPEPILKNQIVFTGSVPYLQMPLYMNLVDCLVLPYPDHSFFHFSPMKLFESMAMDKLLVASKIGQVGEMLINSQDAILYSPQDPHGLEQALQKALLQIQTKKHMGDNRQSIRQKHQWIHRGQVIKKACIHAMEKKGAF